MSESCYQVTSLYFSSCTLRCEWNKELVFPRTLLRTQLIKGAIPIDCLEWLYFRFRLRTSLRSGQIDPLLLLNPSLPWIVRAIFGHLSSCI